MKVWIAHQIVAEKSASQTHYVLCTMRLRLTLAKLSKHNLAGNGNARLLGMHTYCFLCNCGFLCLGEHIVAFL